MAPVPEIPGNICALDSPTRLSSSLAAITHPFSSSLSRGKKEGRVGMGSDPEHRNRADAAAFNSKVH
jgi:hypothetical protein